ncbi:MAG: hypothetical protein HRF50_16420 [Phycisphaerae bacterium]|jgi:hypothetical protein
MIDVQQELMTPQEAAKWFRRSPSWLRQQQEIVRLGGPGGQPLYHTRVCRAYVLARLCGLRGEALRRAQLEALAAVCGVPLAELRSVLPDAKVGIDSRAEAGAIGVQSACAERRPAPQTSAAS